jgi:hypothetical protein
VFTNLLLRGCAVALAQRRAMKIDGSVALVTGANRGLGQREVAWRG